MKVQAKNLLINKLDAEIKDLKKTLNGKQHQYDMLKEKYDNLIKENKELKEKLNGYEIPSDNLPRNVIIDNIFKNQNREPNGHRFSVEMFSFSQLIHNISPKCYELLQNILILPSQAQL